MGVEENKVDRESAEEIMQCYCNCRPRFYEELARLCAAKAGLVVTAPVKTTDYIDAWQPLNEQEAIRFEKQPIPWRGEFAGKEVGIVPTHRIDWYVENDFAIMLKRYTLSDRYKKRQREEG